MNVPTASCFLEESYQFEVGGGGGGVAGTLSSVGYENAIDYFKVSGSYPNYFRCLFVN